MLVEESLNWKSVFFFLPDVGLTEKFATGARQVAAGVAVGLGVGEGLVLGVADGVGFGDADGEELAV
jgi:hypothetical protein